MNADEIKTFVESNFHAITVATNIAIGLTVIVICSLKRRKSFDTKESLQSKATEFLMKCLKQPNRLWVLESDTPNYQEITYAVMDDYKVRIAIKKFFPLPKADERQIFIGDTEITKYHIGEEKMNAINKMIDRVLGEKQVAYLARDLHTVMSELSVIGN